MTTSAPNGNRHPLGYNAAFDGLRAVAVLAVVFDHFGVPGLRGGPLGVDIFFVLSGYLITAVLQRGSDREQTLGAFYCRRFLRLTPALAFVCVALLLIAPVLGVLPQARRDIMASMLYISNWTRAIPAGAPMYLGNTWSLSIEEQFYILWPVLMVGSRRLWGSGALRTALVLLATSLLWLYWMAHGGGSEDRLYNGLDTRCFGLLLGCTASLGRNRFLRLGRSLEWASVIAFIAGLVMLAQIAWSPSATVCMAVAATVMIVDVDLSPAGMLARCLKQWPLTAIGRISYALYLWHYPIMLIVFREMRMTWAAGAAFGIATSLAAATVSYVLIERPALRLRDSLSEQGSARLGQAAVTMSVLGMLAGTWIFWSADIVQRFSPTPLAIVTYGPTTIRKGDEFNVQPDGTSVLWVATNHSIPTGARIRIGDNLLITIIQGASGAAIVPSQIRDTLGRTTLSIVGPDGANLAGPASFEVTP